jgi:hypothetical protein
VHASAGDWIRACRDANGIDVGQPGRTQANRDIPRITSAEASYK